MPVNVADSPYPVSGAGVGCRVVVFCLPGVFRPMPAAGLALWVGVVPPGGGWALAVVWLWLWRVCVVLCGGLPGWWCGCWWGVPACGLCCAGSLVGVWLVRLVWAGWVLTAVFWLVWLWWLVAGGWMHQGRGQGASV